MRARPHFDAGTWSDRTRRAAGPGSHPLRLTAGVPLRSVTSASLVRSPRPGRRGEPGRGGPRSLIRAKPLRERGARSGHGVLLDVSRSRRRSRDRQESPRRARASHRPHGSITNRANGRLSQTRRVPSPRSARPAPRRQAGDEEGDEDTRETGRRDRASLRARSGGPRGARLRGPGPAFRRNSGEAAVASAALFHAAG